MNRFFVIVQVLSIMLSTAVFAGSLDSSGAPSSGSGMPNLTDIYNQLETGTTSTPATSFQEPSAGPTAGTGRSLSEINAMLPVPDNSNGAATSDVLSGKTFWGLRTDGTWGLKAGSLSSGSDVSGGEGMRTFSIPAGYYSGKTATANDADLVSGNIKSGVSIFGVTGKTEVVDTTEGASPAAAGDLLSGKKAFVNGAPVTGSMPTRSLSNTSTTVNAGYYNATTLNTVDPDLASANIKAGTTIFGVTGNSNVVDTGSGDATATEIKNGKKAWVDGSEVTGTMSGGGYPCTTGNLSPLGRWCDNGNGTVRDMSTGLLWLKDAGWGGLYPVWANSASTTNVHDRAASLSNGNPAALTDGSVEGSWRIPTKSELVTLTTGTEAARASAMYLFTNIVNGSYWSSSTRAGSPGEAWYVDAGNGFTTSFLKVAPGNVWPVRAGQ